MIRRRHLLQAGAAADDDLLIHSRQRVAKDGQDGAADLAQVRAQFLGGCLLIGRGRGGNDDAVVALAIGGEGE